MKKVCQSFPSFYSSYNTCMQLSEAQELVKQGEARREAADFEGAIKFLTEAIKLLTKEKSYADLVVAYKDLSLTYVHKYNYGEGSSNLDKAKQYAEGMLTVARKHAPDSIALAYFTLAKAVELQGDLTAARTAYKQALELYKGSLAERGDYRYHYGEALYITGDKSEGKRQMETGLAEIRDGVGEVDDFLTAVWETRCLIRLAYVLNSDDPAAATKYRGEAKNHLEADLRLVILKKQFLELFF